MKALLIGFLTLGSISAFSQIVEKSEEVRMVADLRSRFAKAVVPKGDYLLQHDFECKETIARKGEFRQIDMTDLSFVKYKGVIRIVQYDNIMVGRLLNNNGQELIGLYIQPVESFAGLVTQAYRVDTEGSLIAEFTLVNDKYKFPKVLYPLSASSGMVMSYTLCKPK